MAMIEAPFDTEKELGDWVRDNLDLFIPGAINIPGHQVSTTTGKRGVPDGFAFNLREKEWFVIEDDLLAHGVWTHIAEQIV